MVTPLGAIFFDGPGRREAAVARPTRWRQLSFPQPMQSHRAAIAAASSTILSGKGHVAIQTAPPWGSTQERPGQRSIPNSLPNQYHGAMSVQDTTASGGISGR